MFWGFDGRTKGLIKDVGLQEGNFTEYSKGSFIGSDRFPLKEPFYC